ncbi:MAG TPA: RDD family protein [Longimicrobium sp.]|jgi:uncharacterized RDD family membrane protein YckC
MDQETPRTQANPGAQQPGGPSPVQYVPAPVTGQPDLVKRGIALFIDCVIAGVAYGAFVFVGIIAAFASGFVSSLIVSVGAAAAAAVILLRDVALQGRSPGKKVLGLAVVTSSGGPITATESIKRNLPLAVGFAGGALGFVPILGAFVGFAASLAQLGLFVYEIYLIANNQQRLGDQLAGTQVVFQGQPAIAL